MLSDDGAVPLFDPTVELPLALALAALAVAVWWWRGRSVARPPAGPLSAAEARGRRLALAIGVVAIALRVPWSAPEPMDHLEYALVVETDLAESWTEVLVNRVGIEQAHQPLSRVPIALARKAGFRPEATRWVQLGAWVLALVAAWKWLCQLVRPWAGGDEARALGLAVSAFAWVAFSPLGVRYGFDVTPYGLLVCLAWWGAVALLEVASGRGEARWAAALLAAAAFYTHYVELWFFVGAAGVAWLAAGTLVAEERRRARLDLVFAAALFGLAVVPWIPAMRWGVELFRTYVSREAELYPRDFSMIAQLGELARIVTGIRGAGVILAVGMLVAVVTSRGRPGRSVVHALIGLAPFMVFRGYQDHQYAQAAGGTYFGARHFLPFLPLLAVAVIGAVGGLVDRFVAPPRVVFRLVILGALPACALVTAGERHRHAERPDIRSAAAYLREHLEDGDAVGVLPRFFYSALVVDEVSAGRIDFQRAFGFARLPLGQADRADPMVWLPADDREFPLPEALENRAFHRVWVLDFQEREFGLLELSPVVSRRVTSHMDAGHTLLERRSFDQLVLSLYRLDRRRESWAGGPWVMNEANWREHARDVSWSTDGDRLVYRIDLPTADVTRLAELALTFPAADQPHAATRTDLTISAGIDTALDLPADEATRTVQFVAPEGQPLILRLDYPKDRARVPTQVSLRTVAGVF